MKFEAEIILFLQNLFEFPLFINFFKIITYLGSYVGIFLLFLILFFLTKDKILAFIYALTSILAAGLNLLIKLLINRTRPYISYPNIKNYLKAMGTSMPSSHSIVICIFVVFSIFATLKFVKNKKLKLALILLSITTGIIVLISRMVLGQHYLTDILVGVLLGLIYSYFALKIYKKVKNKLTNKKLGKQ